MMLRHSILFTLALLTLGACAPGERAYTSKQRADISQAHVGVVGGRLVAPGTALSKQVALLDERCSATFIARNIVLTASHCFPERGTSGVVRFTDDGTTSTFETRYDAVIMHPDYDPYGTSSAHDIALLHTVDPLPEAFTLTQLSNQLTPDKTPTKASGRGRQHYPNQLGPHPFFDKKLREVDFTNLKLLRKKRDLWYAVKISELSGVSSGDSGGPLFVNEGGVLKQMGVASSIADDVTGGDVVYASVVLNADWITQTSAELLKK